MPRGGFRVGGGRKSKAEELGLPKLIEDVIGESGKRQLVEVLFKKAKAGSFPHHQLLMAYTFGKPVEKHDVDQKTEISIVYADGIADLISPAA